MARAAIFFAIAIVTVLPASAADRLTDRDVKELVARVEEGRDRFDNALDGDLKRSILRGPSGDVNVEQVLNDFQASIDRLEEQLKPEYTAGAEAGTLLRHASAIDRFFRGQPAGTKGGSEWNRLATDLTALARAYGTTFPLPDNPTVRRIGDREVAAAADEIARSAEQLKESLDNDLKKDSSVDKATREAIVSEADQLSKDAKDLRDRVKDSNPSSAEADRLLKRAAKVQSFIATHKVPGAAGAWSALNPRLQSLATLYSAP